MGQGEYSIGVLCRLETIPVIDVFAGPGGLGEGFSAYASDAARFDVRLSVEMDPVACATLRLRTFFHMSKGPSRNSYYAYLRGQIVERELAHRHPELWQQAQDRVVNAELGAKNTRMSIHRSIRKAIGREHFVLIGGPPCQAYSIIGRSRRLGIGASATDSNVSRNRKRLETDFYSDPKHRLYCEYLEIIAVHRPVAFVMENVKGLSSARTTADDEKGGMFDLIRSDLENPAKALESSISSQITNEFGQLKRAKYRLYALAKPPSLFNDESPRASDFVLRCEDYGVPQTRHRIIILGVREDVQRIPKPLLRQPTASAKSVLDSLPPLRSALSKSDGDWYSAIEHEAGRIPESVQEDLQIPKLLRRIRSHSRSLTTGQKWYPNLELAGEEPSAVMKWLIDPRLPGALLHEARSHMASDLARYLYCSAFALKYGRSPSLEEWPGSLRPAHDNVQNHKGKLHVTGFSDRFKVQGLVNPRRIPQPSSTITSHIAKDGHYYIHFDPTQCRSLTVREAARLQTFPDNYFFCGNRTQQYHQVGNAVPPFLAKQIASIVARTVLD